MEKNIETAVENTINNLKIAVAFSGKSATEISRNAELSPNVLGKFLRKETSISYANLVAICAVLDIPMPAITSDKQITPARIRLFRALTRMPDERVAEALQLIQEQAEAERPDAQ